MKKVIRHSKFKSNPFGDGAEKRTAQLKEIFQDNQIEFEDVSFSLPKNLGMKDLVLYVFKSFSLMLNYFKLKDFKSISHFVGSLKTFALRYPIIKERYQNEQVVFIWESTVPENYSYPYLFKNENHVIIAMTHNLESFVPGLTDVFTGKISPVWFEDELKRLSLCDAVFTVSREEYWLLKIYGLNAYYLPYYPAREAERFLLDIRNKRQLQSLNKGKKKILLLGTANNPPTLEGMKQFINYFDKYPHLAELHIAGYGTEALASYVSKDSTVILHGSLNNDDLTELLIQIDSVLVHQQATSGALNRIPEMLIAGIPLLVYADAARNIYNIDGVTIYYNYDELMRILHEYNPPIPAMYPKPDNLIRDYVKMIQDYLN